MRITRTALAIPAAALLAGLSLTAFPAAAGAAPRDGGGRATVDPGVAAQLSTGQPLVDVVVVLRQQADLSRISYRNRAERLARVENALRTTAASGQRGVLGYLRGAASQVAAVTPLWISNEVEVKATPAVIRALAARGDVREIQPERTIQAPPRPLSLPTAARTAAGPASPSAAVLAAAAAPE